MTKRAPNRNRHVPYSIRFSPEERERAAALRDRTGLPLSALIRRALFDTPLPRATRRPTVNHKLAARILAAAQQFTSEINKIGSNINQLAKHANAGHPQWNAIQSALQQIDDIRNTALEIRTGCMEALGREQDRNGKPDGA